MPFEGAKFQWLSANVVVTATGQTLLPAYGVKRFQGVPVAFIGMTLKDTPGIVVPTGVAGLEFRDEAATVNALVPKLRAEGIEAIVVLVHEGGMQSGSLQDINGCAGNLAGPPIAAHREPARRRGGRGDQRPHPCRLQLPAAQCQGSATAGEQRQRLRPRAQRHRPDARPGHARRRRGAGRPTGWSTATTRRSHPTPRWPASSRATTRWWRRARPWSSAAITSELPNNASDAACNMPAGELIADAQLAATAAPAFGGAAIAFMNRGGVRTPGFTYQQRAGEGDGNVTYGEAFTAQPFGNSLVTMTLTAQDIKDVLEQQFAGCRGQLPSATRLHDSVGRLQGTAGTAPRPATSASIR